MKTPGWLFIVGPARSGTTLFASLLDGHPDLLVWPFEWRYFTEHYDKCRTGSSLAPGSALKEGMAPILRRFREKTFSTYYSTIDVDRAVDHEAFDVAVRNAPDGPVDAVDFLAAVFEGFARSTGREPGTVRYNAIKCMAKGFDWRRGDLLKSARFIYLHRPVDRRYMSQRNKFIEKFHCGPAETFERCTRLYFENKLDLEVRKRFLHLPTVKTVELDDLKKDPESVMRGVAAFLDIPFEDCLLAPTFLGKLFEGHFHDPSLNKGKILNTESRHTPLTAFEKALLTAFDDPAGPPPAHRLVMPFFRSVLRDVADIFPGIRPGERLAAARTMAGYWLETRKLFQETLTDAAYPDWKARYPYIQ